MLVSDRVQKPRHRFVIVHDVVQHKEDIKTGFDISHEQFDSFLSKITYRCRIMDATPVSDAVTVTVDDGLSSSMAIADLVERHGQRAVFFISTSLVGTAGYLKKDEIVELANRGHEIGGHGHSHEALDKMSEIRCAVDLSRCSDLLSDILGFHPTSFALPFGRANQVAIDCLAKSGFEHVLCSLYGKSIDPARYGMIRRNCLHVNDIDVSHITILDGRHDWKGSNFAQAIRKLVGRNSIS